MSENPGYIHGVRLAELEMNDVSGTHRGLTVLNTLVEPLEAFYPEGAEMRLGPVDIFTVEAPVQVLPLA
jgi:hypothetical protein